MSSVLQLYVSLRLLLETSMLCRYPTNLPRWIFRAHPRRSARTRQFRKEPSDFSNDDSDFSNDGDGDGDHDDPFGLKSSDSDDGGSVEDQQERDNSEKNQAQVKKSVKWASRC
ncbi:hypothetical protein RHMOL_Rhmol05G0225900 [Rhododendron molle]|uniref:Uncharacterized protein n=1 Tax=Rhododendron molle TaxID=49168 RepID=A0ACC0NRX6_RHOML|nr:hypothetical protein RHMOL_Rhmol05G0225900 [Rhododendron molle]